MSLLTKCSQAPVRVPVGDPARERLSADGTILFIQSDSPPGNKAGLYSAGTASSSRLSPPPAIPLWQPARCAPGHAHLCHPVCLSLLLLSLPSPEHAGSLGHRLSLCHQLCAGCTNKEPNIQQQTALCYQKEMNGLE